jgi:SAM-dependent methyltransferase
MTRKVDYLPNAECSCCASTKLEQIFAMPKFPQIAVFADSPDDSDFPPVDNALNICADCGHMQLQNNVDPNFLYDRSFTHRTTCSHSASSANLAFANYVKKVANGRHFKRIVEIGCNDAFLLNHLIEIGDTATGIDPVWKGREGEFVADLEPEVAKKIKCIGNFVEEVDFETELGGKPDLIVSSFVFEHIRAPRQLLERIFEVVDDNALFVIQVPGTDMLLDNCRFDQLSHQHYQQWTLDSFRKTIENAGGVYLGHNVMYEVWGAMMMMFKKGPGVGPKTDFRRATKELVLERKRIFDAHLAAARKAVEFARPRPVYAFGAAQNFPSLAYFLGGDVSFFECILDDNPARQDKFFPGFPVQTRQPTGDMNLEKSAIMITGPDYGRVLIKRASELKPEQIILPFSAI